MKTVHLLFILCFVLIVNTGIIAQQANIKQKSVSMNRVTKHSNKKELPAQTETYLWTRIIYREINMLNEQNHPLYQHLFSLLFGKIAEGKLHAYQYLDGKEVFENRYKLGIDELAQQVDLHENDVQRIHAFYLKECWYFNQHTSEVAVKLLALCPVLYSYSDNGTELRMPLCWVLYEAALPYLSEVYLKTSNKNNALQLTFSNYFTLRLFRGDIIKTENLLNQTLIQYCLTPDALQKERVRIENELSGFITHLSCP